MVKFLEVNDISNGQAILLNLMYVERISYNSEGKAIIMAQGYDGWMTAKNTYEEIFTILDELGVLS